MCEKRGDSSGMLMLRMPNQGLVHNNIEKIGCKHSKTLDLLHSDSILYYLFRSLTVISFRNLRKLSVQIRRPEHPATDHLRRTS